MVTTEQYFWQLRSIIVTLGIIQDFQVHDELIIVHLGIFPIIVMMATPVGLFPPRK